MIKYQKGSFLIEAIVFMVVIGLALGGIVMTHNVSVKNSQYPLEQRAGIEIASGLLEEVMEQPFTYCDPDDPAMPAATSTASCAIVSGIGPNPGESRGGAVPFDNVGDYSGLTLAPPTGPSGEAITGLPSGWQASVTIASVAMTPTSGSSIPANGSALKIDVKAISPSGREWVLTGYRTRHAPNSQ